MNGAVSQRRRYAARFIAIVLAAVLAWAAWAAKGYLRPEAAAEAAPADRPIEFPDDGYVTSRACRSCHPQQYATWHASYHRTMTQVASPSTVVAPFDDVQLQEKDRTYDLEKRGGEFWVRIRDTARPGEADLILPDGRVDDARDRGSSGTQKRVVMTTGSHHQQIYWFATGDSRKVDYVPFIYLIGEQRWVPRNSAFLRPPENARQEQPGLWNMSCSRCHTTHARPRLDEHDHMDTLVAEIGISCEACHGECDQHVRANRDVRRRYRLRITGQPDPTVTEPAKLSHRRASQVCGQCHSVNQFYSEEDERAWTRHGYSYRPGQELADTRMLIRYSLSPEHPRLKGLLHYYPQYMEDYFWSDGMIRVSGREYNGLQETPCFQRGELSCLSCHSMHKDPDDARPVDQWANDQLKPGMDSNRACLQCHESYCNDIQQHTHHAPESSGSQCYNCHMPHTSYGLLKALRSHQIDSPRVSASLETGRPNGCNLCHLDKTLRWTSNYLAQWYGQEQPWLADDEQTTAASLLWLLRGDAGQRALIAWTMGWEPARQASGEDWIAPFLAQLLDDPYDAVRFIAHRSLRRAAEFRDIPYDFVDAAANRTKARQAVLNRWQENFGQRRQSRAAVLIDANGNLQRDVIERLLHERDDRRVNLNE